VKGIMSSELESNTLEQSGELSFEHRLEKLKNTSCYHPLSGGKHFSYKKQQSVVNEYLDIKMKMDLADFDIPNSVCIEEWDTKKLVVECSNSSSVRLNSIHKLMARFEHLLSKVEAQADTSDKNSSPEEGCKEVFEELDQISALIRDEKFQKKVEEAVERRRKKRLRQRRSKQARRHRWEAEARRIDARRARETARLKKEEADKRLKTQVGFWMSFFYTFEPYEGKYIGIQNQFLIFFD